MPEKEEDKYKYISRGCRCSPKELATGAEIFDKSCAKMDTTLWLKGFKGIVPNSKTEFLEVRFKNSRKEFFSNPDNIPLNIGDVIAVDANPGHDIGIVNMTGIEVLLQMKKKRINPAKADIKKVYRKAKQHDIDKWIQSINSEAPTMFKARKIAEDLGLNMKICDVEYQGDKTKATFYYTAPDRVDFRELIKVYGENFEVRVDMRQIGARQEASKIGGLGICGRELCCSTWLSSFESITTNKARNQQIALNTEKLTGLCCKLKCCFNYENQWYVQALKEFPNSNIILKTKKGDFKCHKTDVIKRTMSYFPLREKTNEMLVISIENIKKIIEMNSKGVIPEDIDEFVMIKEKPIDYGADITMEDLTKFEDRDDNDQVR